MEEKDFTQQQNLFVRLERLNPRKREDNKRQWTTKREIDANGGRKQRLGIQREDGQTINE